MDRDLPRTPVPIVIPYWLYTFRETDMIPALFFVYDGFTSRLK